MVKKNTPYVSQIDYFLAVIQSTLDSSLIVMNKAQAERMLNVEMDRLVHLLIPARRHVSTTIFLDGRSAISDHVR